ncbi:hypothetical protein ACMXYV_16240 [Neptuniibacter sp. SY11_33]|uniref:hypothetical protein n=1 Tax=Neptuniibacter sp. SY11_33 TaxID=3398215 RepID=UPI0039F51D9E
MTLKNEVGAILRKLGLLLFTAIIIGCSSEPIPQPMERSQLEESKQIKKTAVLSPPKPLETEPEIYPLTLNITNRGNFRSVSDYLNPLLSTLSAESVYRLHNAPDLRDNYRFQYRIRSTDRSKTAFALKQSGAQNWGYVTTSVGRNSVANAFMVEQEQDRFYVLVLKRLKICLVQKASGAPRWQKGKWVFPRRAGVFECTGSSQRGVFQSESGFPQLLGPYYGETDTVLVFNTPAELKKMTWALKRQFPQLVIPVISAGRIQ